MTPFGVSMRVIYFPKEVPQGTTETIMTAKPVDWEFMRQSSEVLKDIPDTWKRYPETEAGLKNIIEMEFGEFMTTETKGMSKEDRSRELVHLASACLHLWRYLNVK